MNGNLDVAIKLLQDEIDYAEKGVEYWQSTAAELKQLQAEMIRVKKKSSNKLLSQLPKKISVQKNTLPVPVFEKTEVRDKYIPSTAGDFWLKQFESSPLTSAQLLTKAAKALKLPLVGDNKKKLGSRLATAIQKLSKEDGKIDVQGQGRLRAYSLKESRK
jgi:hypothetical protein